MIWTVLVNGLPGLLDPGFLTTSMNGVTGAFDNKAVEEGAPVLGGIYHALLGTVQITLLATVISVPVGLLTAIYLVEYGNDRPLARAITFFVDVMTGIPSIVAGLFAAAFFFAVVGPGTKTGAVAAVALSVLMIPVVVRSSEEMLKIVPNELREAAYALGVRKWRTILKVVIPTAISGIASGVTLAIARVIGETAPILVTAGLRHHHQQQRVRRLDGLAAHVHLHADPQPDVAVQPGPVRPAGLGRGPGADHPGDAAEPRRPPDRPRSSPPRPAAEPSPRRSPRTQTSIHPQSVKEHHV